MKSVLLTGATGFVGGCAIAPLLEKGYTVHAVTSKSELPKSDENLIWHKANLLDSDEAENLLKIVRPTHLLHFAWYVEHGKFWNATENVDWLKASLHLVQKFVECGGKRVVVAGTLSEYEESEEDFLSEEIKLDPQSLYAATKTALYQTLEKYTEVVGVSFAWGRVFFMFGKHEPPNRLVPAVICSLLNNETAKTSHGNQIRDFMSTEETAQAYVALLDSDVRGAVNIGSGEARTIKELVLEIAASTGSSPENIQF
ncbi:MAG: NAD-dependent epimerase/dehydratase family protein, partial [Acidobacteriota bacterium]|nr:NAD-dependent epimerase/dehydratase family protein [Acidobacteriota bacterium]